MKQFNILLVEDEESTRETYRQLLEGAGFRVHAAADYDEALARLDVAIDLALIDVVLQGDRALRYSGRYAGGNRKRRRS